MIPLETAIAALEAELPRVVDPVLRDHLRVVLDVMRERAKLVMVPVLEGEAAQLFPKRK